jgi:hypothetical protein
VSSGSAETGRQGWGDWPDATSKNVSAMQPTNLRLAGAGRVRLAATSMKVPQVPSGLESERSNRRRGQTHFISREQSSQGRKTPWLGN